MEIEQNEMKYSKRDQLKTVKLLSGFLLSHSSQIKREQNVGYSIKWVEFMPIALNFCPQPHYNGSRGLCKGITTTILAAPTTFTRILSQL
jgi:hypothetical protein